VWDYPRPPAVEEVDVRVQVLVGDAVVADSTHCLRVLETGSPPTVYVPPRDVAQDLLLPEAGTSFCEWKGEATYFGVRSTRGVSHHAAWCYANPFDEYAVLAGCVSFYPGRVDRCTYGGETVKAQAGGFYGGWITSNLAGPFKGQPGTESW
jgi:uncharacterized protein (DUF427 family)